MFCLLFPGQGSQYVGMYNDIAIQYGKEVFECINDISGRDITKLMSEGPEDELNVTLNSQLAIVGLSISCFKGLKDMYDIDISAIAGHSVGEFAALYCGGGLELEQCVSTLNLRAEIMHNVGKELDSGMMAVIKPSLNLPEILEKHICYVSCNNTPIQVVIGGKNSDIDQVANSQCGRKAIKLKVSGAFHTPIMEPATHEFAKSISINIKPNFMGYFSNVTAKLEANNIQELLPKQISSTVQWNSTMQNIISSHEGIRFIELGPGSVLSGMLKNIDKSQVSYSINDISTLRQLEI